MEMAFVGGGWTIDRYKLLSTSPASVPLLCATLVVSMFVCASYIHLEL